MLFYIFVEKFSPYYQFFLSASFIYLLLKRFLADISALPEASESEYTVTVTVPVLAVLTAARACPSNVWHILET